MTYDFSNWEDAPERTLLALQSVSTANLAGTADFTVHALCRIADALGTEHVDGILFHAGRIADALEVANEIGMRQTRCAEEANKHAANANVIALINGQGDYATDPKMIVPTISPLCPYPELLTKPEDSE